MERILAPQKPLSIATENYDNEDTNMRIKADYKEYGLHGVAVDLRGIATYKNGVKVADSLANSGQ